MIPFNNKSVFGFLLPITKKSGLWIALLFLFASLTFLGMKDFMGSSAGDFPGAGTAGPIGRTPGYMDHFP